MLSYDVYIKKLLIEKMIDGFADRMGTSGENVGKHRRKNMKKDRKG
jgi:hypothetical protein